MEDIRAEPGSENISQENSQVANQQQIQQQQIQQQQIQQQQIQQQPQQPMNILTFGQYIEYKAFMARAQEEAAVELCPCPNFGCGQGRRGNFRRQNRPYRRRWCSYR